MTPESQSILSQFGSSAHERIERALAATRRGLPVLVLDDEIRENEADMIVAAEKITVPAMTTLIRHGSGIVCLCLEEARLRHLELPQMVANNNCVNQTAFTVSIEARHGVTTGVSAADRVRTIQVAINPASGPGDLARPGHVFPLRAKAGGVRERRGHTEGAVELARAAGLAPAGVLCELMNDDGSMARGAEVTHFAKERGLAVICIQDIVDFRLAGPARAERAA